MCLNSKKRAKGGKNKAFYNTDTRMTKKKKRDRVEAGTKRRSWCDSDAGCVSRREGGMRG